MSVLSTLVDFSRDQEEPTLPIERSISNGPTELPEWTEETSGRRISTEGTVDATDDDDDVCVRRQFLRVEMCRYRHLHRMISACVTRRARNSF